jgi:hypothetical protein
MAWYQVATGKTLDELADNVPAKYAEVPVGKRIRVLINTSPFPVASVFDLAGAELAAKLLVHNGKLLDASANGMFEIQLDIEAVDNGATDQAQLGQGAEMAFPAVMVAAVVIGLIAAAILAPVLMKLTTLFASYIPSADGDSGGGGGLMDYFKLWFGDYTPYIMIGGVLLLLFLLKPTRQGQGAPAITYLLPGGK